MKLLLPLQFVLYIYKYLSIYLLMYLLLEPSPHKLGSIHPNMFCIGVSAADPSVSAQTQQPLWRHAPLLCADVPRWPLTPGTGQPSRQGCWNNMLLFSLHCQRQITDSSLLVCMSKSLHRGHYKQKQKKQVSKFKEAMWWHLTCSSGFFSNTLSDLPKYGP